MTPPTVCSCRYGADPNCPIHYPLAASQDVRDRNPSGSSPDRGHLIKHGKAKLEYIRKLHPDAARAVELYSAENVQLRSAIYGALSALAGCAPEAAAEILAAAVKGKSL